MKNKGIWRLKFLLLICTLALAACASSDEDKSNEDESSKLENSTTDIHNLYEKSLKQNQLEATPATTQEVKVKEISLHGSAALKRELNQVLTFHCMKYRRRFSSDNECPEKVNRLIDICEQNYTNFSPEFVRCLKSKLKDI